MLPNLFYTINFSVSIIASIIALIFAFLILLIVIINRHCRTIANLLTCNTSIATILYYLLNITSVTFSLRDDWAYHQPACTFRAYCYTTLCAAICYSYSIQAISRLFFTVFFKHKCLQTWYIHWMMIITSWLISILMPIIPFFFEHGYGLEVEAHLCVPSTKIFFTSIFYVIIAFVIPLNIVTIIYTIIFYYVRQSTRRVIGFISNTTTMTITTNNTILNVRREMKLMKNMSILISLLICGGTPYLILVLWHVILTQSPPESFHLLSTNFIPIFIALKMIALFCMCRKVKHSALQYLRKLKQC
jgi:hypothetical protein